MNTQLNSMNASCSINIHDVYNFSSINHNEISKKKNFFYIKANAAHAKRKRHHEQFQFILFHLRRIFIFETTFVIEQFINYDAHRRCHVVVILKHRDKKLLKF